MRNEQDPRAVRSRAAMLAAAREILQGEGPNAVTHQRVAQRAGVGRATAYRHWPRPEQLLLDAMSGVDLPFFKDPVSPVRPWLRGHLRELADQLRMPAVAAISGTLIQASLWDAEMAARRDAFVAGMTGQLGDALDLAVATAELATTWTARDAAALLIGPLLYRATMQTDDVSAELIDQLLDTLGTWRD